MTNIVLELFIGFISAIWFAYTILSDGKERALIKDSNLEFFWFALSIFSCFYYPYLTLAIQALFKIVPFTIECYFGFVNRKQ